VGRARKRWFDNNGDEQKTLCERPVYRTRSRRRVERSFPLIDRSMKGNVTPLCSCIKGSPRGPPTACLLSSSTTFVIGRSTSRREGRIVFGSGKLGAVDQLHLPPVSLSQGMMRVTFGKRRAVSLFAIVAPAPRSLRVVNGRSMNGAWHRLRRRDR
jgi:hypothetical protein